MINVTLGAAETQTNKPFPKLMQESISGTIFYFHRPGLGLPLNDKERFTDHPEWSSAWVMEAFTDYNEPITIQNA